MAHGNKKYNFEDLKEQGSEIIVKSANLQSLRNSLKRYCKDNTIRFERDITHSIQPTGLCKFRVTLLKKEVQP